jgi:DNA-binding LacI/PurR family transcriptional regulator
MPKTTAPTAHRPLQMSDLAKIAGVSESTVSRALAGHPTVAEGTRQRIKALATELGYRINPIARSLRAGRSGVIGVVVPLMHERDGHLTDPFMMTMLTHLADELTGRGYSMLLSKAVKDSGTWLDATLAQSIAEGLVIIGQSHEHAAINAAAERGAPLVAWGAQLPGQCYPCVGSDNHRGGALATRHLIERGRRRIAFVGDERLPEVALRYAGYREALAGAGIAFDPRLLLRTPFAADEAHRAFAGLLAQDLPLDGVAAASDVIAISAIRALHDRGLRVPEDVAVVGFDDVPIAQFARPALTTVRQDLPRAAALLVQALIERIDGGQPRPAPIEPMLVVRESA